MKSFGQTGNVEKLTEKILKRIASLEPSEFMGVCTILGVKLYKEKTEEDKLDQSNELNVEGAPSTNDPKKDELDVVPRDFTDLWSEVCEKVDQLNRKRRRTLDRLLRAATKKGK